MAKKRSACFTTHACLTLRWAGEAGRYLRVPALVMKMPRRWSNRSAWMELLEPLRLGSFMTTRCSFMRPTCIPQAASCAALGDKAVKGSHLMLKED